MDVRKLDPDEWAQISENAHISSFEEVRPSRMDRIDFALLGVRDGTALSWCTVRELDEESVYWQYGGALPNTKGTPTSYRSYESYADWCFREGYKRITTYIENTNLPMLRIALKVGFLIIGTRNFQGSVLLELLLEEEYLATGSRLKEN